MYKSWISSFFLIFLYQNTCDWVRRRGLFSSQFWMLLCIHLYQCGSDCAFMAADGCTWVRVHEEQAKRKPKHWRGYACPLYNSFLTQTNSGDHWSYLKASEGSLQWPQSYSLKVPYYSLLPNQPSKSLIIGVQTISCNNKSSFIIYEFCIFI